MQRSASIRVLPAWISTGSRRGHGCRCADGRSRRCAGHGPSLGCLPVRAVSDLPALESRVAELETKCARPD